MKIFSLQILPFGQTNISETTNTISNELLRLESSPSVSTLGRFVFGLSWKDVKVRQYKSSEL